MPEIFQEEGAPLLKFFVFHRGTWWDKRLMCRLLIMTVVYGHKDKHLRINMGFCQLCGNCPPMCTCLPRKQLIRGANL